MCAMTFLELYYMHNIGDSLTLPAVDYQTKSNQIYFSVAGNDNTQYKSIDVKYESPLLKEWMVRQVDTNTIPKLGLLNIQKLSNIVQTQSSFKSLNRRCAYNVVIKTIPSVNAAISNTIRTTIDTTVLFLYDATVLVFYYPATENCVKNTDT